MFKRPVLLDSSLYCDSVYFLKLHTLQRYVSILKVSWFFDCYEGGSTIKTVKTKENGRCILDEMHGSLLCFKVIAHVTLMQHRELN